MRIAMIGSGYVGLISAACLAEYGHEVVCVERGENTVESLNEGNVPFYEPGLEEIVKNGLSHNRLRFTSNLAEAVRDAEVIFIAVSTPSRRGDGHADLSYLYAVAEDIAQLIENYTVVAIKSTVPIGTASKVDVIIRNANPRAPFDIVANPEFMREGSAVHDFSHPQQLVFGARSEHASALIRRVYRPLEMLEMSLESAEAVNYAANALRSVEISFMNELSELCEKSGADVQDVTKGMGGVSEACKIGIGYGGSSLPKDNRVLMRTAKEAGAPLSILRAAIASNDKRKHSMVDKIVRACGGEVAGKTLAIWGVTAGTNTDDIRESPSLDVILGLQLENTKLQIYDPKGMGEARKLLPGVNWCADAASALEKADALVIMTAWKEFRGIDVAGIKNVLKTSLIIDLCDLYDADEMYQQEFDYVSIGRKPMFGASTVELKKKFGT